MDDGRREDRGERKAVGRSTSMNVILSGAKDQVGTALVSSKVYCRKLILRFAQDDIHTAIVALYWGRGEA
jgi:hypothetical protein